ncbi:MAG: hypothetical protein ACLTAN_06240 [Christensenellaceae bacterium]
MTEEVLSSIGKTSLTLDFATLLAEIAFKRQFGKVFPKGESKNYRLISWLPLGGKLCHAVAVMRGAPHSLRFRSAPSPQGEGFFIASFQGFPFLASPSGKLSTKLTEEVLSSIGKTSLTLDFATFPERGK